MCQSCEPPEHPLVRKFKTLTKADQFAIKLAGSFVLGGIMSWLVAVLFNSTEDFQGVQGVFIQTGWSAMQLGITILVVQVVLARVRAQEHAPLKEFVRSQITAEFVVEIDPISTMNEKLYQFLNPTQNRDALLKDLAEDFKVAQHNANRIVDDQKSFGWALPIAPDLLELTEAKKKLRFAYLAANRQMVSAARQFPLDAPLGELNKADNGQKTRLRLMLLAINRVVDCYNNYRSLLTDEEKAFFITPAFNEIRDAQDRINNAIE